MIRLRTLGTLDLTVDAPDDALRRLLHQPKRIALLVYLTLKSSNGPIRRDTLLGLFWPELSAERARGALSQALYVVRQATGDGLVEAAGQDAVGIDRDRIQCDAAEFESAIAQGNHEQAMALYSGDLLEGFFLSDASEFEHWVEIERTRLRQLAGETTRALAQGEEEAGDLHGAARWARRRVQLAPYDEPSAIYLLELLARAGDRSGAHQEYKLFRDRLRADLDIDPSAEMERALFSLKPPAPPPPIPVPGADGQPAVDPIATHEPGENLRSSAGAPPRRRRWMIPAVASVAVTIVSYFVISGDQLGRPVACGLAGEPGVAVLPFQVVGDDIEYLHEGMVHLLSFNLDGVAGIHKIDPQAVLYAWGQSAGEDGGEPPPEAAAQVACRVGARYAVTGSAVQLGPIVRLTAEVHDADDGESRGSVSVVGSADSALVLVDQLTLQLLREELVPADEAQPSVNLSRVTTASLPALKQYLAGERNYRRAHWKDAAEDFSRAVELDSTFARAMYRLSAAYGWMGEFLLLDEYARKAARFASGLPERDSLLLVGWVDPRPTGILTMERMTSRYPDDVDGWYVLGESYVHLGGVALKTSADIRRAFERAVELNPYYGESYKHLIEDAFARLDSARTQELLTAYEALDPDHSPCPGYRVVSDLVWGSEAERARAVVTLDTIPYKAFQGCARVTIAASQEALESAERSDLASRLVEDSWDTRMRNLVRMLQARTMRGQIAAAYQVIKEAGANPLIEVDAARVTMMFHLSGFSDSAAARRAVAVMSANGDFDDHFWLGAQAAAHGRWGDVEEVGRILGSQATELLSEGNTPQDTLDASYAQADADALRAYVGLVRGDLDRLAEFEEAMLRLSPEGFPSDYLRYQVGKMLFDAGRVREAERYFRSFYPYQWMYLVPSHYYLGRLYEELGRPEDAAYHYGLFVEWWRDADLELRPWRNEAREALTRLAGEPRERDRRN